MQAEAAKYAGYATAAAGLLAFLAGALAYFGVRRQVAAEDDRHLSDRKYDLKRDVYLRVVDAFFFGVVGITELMSDEFVRGKALKDYVSSSILFARIHLVSDISTTKLILNAIYNLGIIQSKLSEQRIRIDAQERTMTQFDFLSTKIKFVQDALLQTSKLNELFSPAIVAMRAEIGMPIDEHDYKQVINEILERSLSTIKATISDLESQRDHLS